MEKYQLYNFLVVQNLKKHYKIVSVIKLMMRK